MTAPCSTSAPRLSRRQCLAGAASLLATPWGAARSAPVADGKPIALVVTYPPGGGADLMARIIAPRMAEALGQTVVVENRPGASGQIAAGLVARARPDGSTLLLDASSFAVNPSLFPRLPYDSRKDFAPLAVLATFPNVLLCTPNFPARSVAEVIAAARKSPGTLAYASSGNGSAQHLAGALFEQRAGVRLSHVPYRGGGPALNDVMGGQVPLFFGNVASALGHIQSGKLRALAVTSKLRARSLPDVPTMEQAGVAGYEVLEWNPVLAPAGADEAVRRRLSEAIRAAVADPEVLARIRALGGDAFPEPGPAGAARFIEAQRAQWARVIHDGQITAG